MVDGEVARSTGKSCPEKRVNLGFFCRISENSIKNFAAFGWKQTKNLRVHMLFNFTAETNMFTVSL